MDFFLQNIVNALQWGSFLRPYRAGIFHGVQHHDAIQFCPWRYLHDGAYIGFGMATMLAGPLCLLRELTWPGWLMLSLTIVISMILTSFLGILVERIGYRPLRDAPRASAAITGLMIGIILETGNLALLGARRLSFPELIQSTTYDLGGVFVTNKKILIVVVSLALMFALHQFIQKTRWGMAMRAMSFDFQVVPLMGVSLNVIAPLTFAIGSALAAAAGILYGVAYPVLDPYMGVLLGWKAFVAAILGGRGSILGAALAGFLLGFIEIFVPMIFPSTLRDLIAYSIILLILTFRPYGFFGQAHSTQLRL
jgi:branched-chain amino acid transport system permease protein